MGNIKKLYQNGRFVGEIQSTGDDLKDIELCRAFLQEKGLYSPTTREQASFRQAVSFATTASYLYKRDLTTVPRNGMSVSPFIVNSAFALELYLKTLASLHGLELRGHDLVDLFDSLPEKAHEDIRSSFPRATWRCEISNLTQFREALITMRRAFIDWRYLHEHVDTVGTQIRFAPLVFTMEVLHDACRTHPELKAGTGSEGEVKN